MEKILLELAANAPAAVGIIVTVILFLKAQAKRDAMLEQIVKANHERETTVLEALERAAQSFGRIEGALDRAERNGGGKPGMGNYQAPFGAPPK